LIITDRGCNNVKNSLFHFVSLVLKDYKGKPLIVCTSRRQISTIICYYNAIVLLASEYDEENRMTKLTRATLIVAVSLDWIKF